MLFDEEVLGYKYSAMVAIFSTLGMMIPRTRSVCQWRLNYRRQGVSLLWNLHILQAQLTDLAPTWHLEVWIPNGYPWEFEQLFENTIGLQLLGCRRNLTNMSDFGFRAHRRVCIRIRFYLECASVSHCSRPNPRPVLLSCFELLLFFFFFYKTLLSSQSSTYYIQTQSWWAETQRTARAMAGAMEMWKCPVQCSCQR